ncbi:MAG: hypothetical protein ACRYHQ_29145 [Janthinobacterium lividum]
MVKMTLAAAMVLGLSAGPLFAQPLAGSTAPALGAAPVVRGGSQSVFTPSGPAVTTGQVGSIGTATLPGGAGTGVLRNNGNGTSTLTGPTGAPSTFSTRR